MNNPGEYISPTVGWAFIPFIGVLVAFAVAVFAVLFWMAGRGFRVRATLATLVALVLGVSGTIGVMDAASSFDQRDAIEFSKYSTEVKTWASHNYGVTLTTDDVADLIAGRPIALDTAGIEREVLLQHAPGSAAVRLVESDGTPLG